MLHPLVLNNVINPVITSICRDLPTAWYAGGQRFESAWLHLILVISINNFHNYVLIFASLKVIKFEKLF